MKETNFNEAQESKEENIDVKELLFKYLSTGLGLWGRVVRV